MRLSNGKVAKMPDKLTDSEIVKDLNEAEDLENVLLYCKNPNKEVMIPIKITDIRDLINRLQAKIDEAEDTIQFADKELKKAEAENETLRSVVKQNHLIRNNNKSPLSLLTNEIKAEAYKEFAERLKEKYGYYDWENKTIVYPEDEIDNLLKELVGEDK